MGEVRHTSSLGIQLVDFHMAQACLMDMPLFFDESRHLPQATYRSATTRAGAKIKICPTAADFGQEGNPRWFGILLYLASRYLQY